MAWTSPTTRVTGELITASIWNTDLTNNLNWLFARPLASQVYNNTGVLTTSSTSFVDADATNLIVTFTTAAARIKAVATFLGHKATGGDGFFDLILDSVTRAGHSTGGLAKITNETTSGLPVTIVGEWSGLSAASHTVKIQFRSSDANSCRILTGVVRLQAVEI